MDLIWLDYNVGDLVLTGVLLVCLYTDIKERKIYNKVTLVGLVAGLLLNFYLEGFSGLFFSLKGLFLGAGLLLLPFAAGGLGAGDVKLLAVVGALKGAPFTFYVFLASALVGGLLSIISLVRLGKLGDTLRNIYTCFKLILFSGFKVNAFSSLQETPQELCIPYGPALAAGVCLIYILQFLDYSLVTYIT